MLFSYGSGQQPTDDNNKCRQIAGNFGCHADAVVRRRTHPPMEQVCLRPIPPAAAMVDKFEWNTQNTNKTQLLASNYGTF